MWSKNELARATLRSVVLALQVAAVLYVTLICWLAAVWMTDDSWAFRAKSLDWWYLAGVRFAQCALAGVALGLVLVGMNKLLARAGLTFPQLGPWKIGIGAVAVIVIVSGIGAARFAIEKPYM